MINIRNTPVIVLRKGSGMDKCIQAIVISVSQYESNWHMCVDIYEWWPNDGRLFGYITNGIRKASLVMSDWLCICLYVIV